jgi:hypothetical protein
LEDDVDQVVLGAVLALITGIGTTASVRKLRAAVREVLAREDEAAAMLRPVPSPEATATVGSTRVKNAHFQSSVPVQHSY